MALKSNHMPEESEGLILEGREYHPENFFPTAFKQRIDSSVYLEVLNSDRIPNCYDLKNQNTEFRTTIPT